MLTANAQLYYDDLIEATGVLSAKKRPVYDYMVDNKGNVTSLYQSQDEANYIRSKGIQYKRIPATDRVVALEKGKNITAASKFESEKNTPDNGYFGKGSVDVAKEKYVDLFNNTFLAPFKDTKKKTEQNPLKNVISSVTILPYNEPPNYYTGRREFINALFTTKDGFGESFIVPLSKANIDKTGAIVEYLEQVENSGGQVSRADLIKILDKDFEGYNKLMYGTTTATTTETEKEFDIDG